MVSVRLHKEVEYGVEKLKYKKLKYEILQSWLINTVYNLLVKNNWEKEEWGGGGLIERGRLLTFFPWKGGGGLLEEGG